MYYIKINKETNEIFGTLISVWGDVPKKTDNFIYIECSKEEYDSCADLTYENGLLTIKRDVNKIKQEKLDELESIISKAYIQGFYSEANGSKLYYDSDVDKQREIMQSANLSDEMFDMLFPKGYPIRARENPSDVSRTILHLTKIEMIQLCKDCLAWCETIKGTNWYYQNIVLSSTDYYKIKELVFIMPDRIVPKLTTMYDTEEYNNES